MKILFSEHARYQTAERNISEDEIVSAVTVPDRIVKQTQEKNRAIKLIKRNGSKYLLVVIYRQTNSTRKIITAFLTTKFKKYLK